MSQSYANLAQNNLIHGLVLGHEPNWHLREVTKNSIRKHAEKIELFRRIKKQIPFKLIIEWKEEYLISSRLFLLSEYPEVVGDNSPQCLKNWRSHWCSTKGFLAGLIGGTDSALSFNSGSLIPDLSFWKQRWRIPIRHSIVLGALQKYENSSYNIIINIV